MAQYIDKSALVAEIERLMSIANSQYDLVGNEDIRNRILWSQQASVCNQILAFIDTLEVKEVIAEQECICNEALNRIVGGSWNLLCHVNKLELKTGDKVKVIIKAQKGE